MKIFLDAGHNCSGADTGAQGNGLKEQDITYQIAQKVADRLENQGIEIRMSRPTIASNVGTTLNESLNGRCNMANSWGADYFISIHCNAASNTSANGTETLIFGNKAKVLADMVNSNLVGLGLTNRGVKQRTDLAVLKHTNMPALLIETAFITNPSDAEILRNKQDDIAIAISNAVFEFVGIEVKNVANAVTTASEALVKIISKGVDTDKDFWLKACEYDTHLDKLLIKIANAM